LERFRDLLLSVWREACRHIEIQESTETIARMLHRHMPVSEVIVRELDVERSRLETVAVALSGRGETPRASSVDLPPAELRRLLSWCRRGEIVRSSTRSLSGPPSALVPADASGEVLIGALATPSRVGALVLVGQDVAAFDRRHELMLQALLEPFAVALDNHHRLRELTALREAAEADKQSLLTRLGRTQLGETVIGADGGLRPVMERLRLVSRSDVPVLILGETGSGKELVARAIHTGSARPAGPFMRVNCGAIPPDLIDSQLFGHERGSFTGATETRKGWFERADGGTLFLDEIGELPLAAQVRLLRILQDGQLERVGGQEAIKVDIRVVTATHRDLTVMVRQGQFREDLWYRIAVFPILLPPLRERKEDIPALARHFAGRAAVRFGLAPRAPTPEDIAALVAYPWPGNVRELITVLDRAAILGNGERLEVTTALGVSSGIAGPTVPSAPPPPERQPRSDSSSSPAIGALDTAMVRHIEQALTATRGRIEGREGAAHLLGINPHTLRARMRKLGIDWSHFRAVLPSAPEPNRSGQKEER
jgi:transcriptional regulator with GAF, ATPase, and Fis domain